MDYNQTQSLWRRLPVGVIILLCFTAALHQRYQPYFAQQSIFREHADFDDLDYHFIAANYALAGRFPYLGFLVPEKDYQFRYEKGKPDGVDAIYLNVFKEVGPVLTFVRPPVYPLAVGVLYKVFGYRLSVLLWFNIFLLAAMAALFPLIGYALARLPGVAAGIAAAVLLYYVHDFEPYRMDVEIPAALLLLLFFYTTVLYYQKNKSSYVGLAGLLTGLLLLTKPSIIFLPVLFFAGAFLIAKTNRGKRLLGQAMVFAAGVAVVVGAWSLYINGQKELTAVSRQQWGSKVKATMPLIAIDSLQQLETNPTLDLLVYKDLVKTFLLLHTQSDSSTVFLGNQFRGGTSLLYLNNEYSVTSGMGSFGWAWKIMRHSYYNTHHLSSSNIMKVFYFYTENPQYIYQIPLKRITCTAEKYPLVFWLAPLLWALCVLVCRAAAVNKVGLRWALLLLLWSAAAAGCWLSVTENVLPQGVVPVLLFVPVYLVALGLYKNEFNGRLSAAYPIVWGSIFLFIVVVLGDHRFTKIAMPLNCFAIAFYSYRLVQQTIKGLRPGA